MGKTHKEWTELCEYVKTNILGYDENQKFPKQLALRLRGLEKGQYIGNNNHEVEANYDYDVILLTFKINRKRIVDYLYRNSAKIKDESHKINLIMKFIEPEINDVYLHLKNNKKTDNISDSNINIRVANKGAEYKNVTREVKSDIIKNLWS